MKLKINIVVLLLVQICFSQSKISKFYMGIKYNSGALENLNQDFKNPTIKDLYNKDLYKNVKLDLTNYGFFAGYMVSENIGIELGVSNYKQFYQTDRETVKDTYQNITSKDQISMIQIKPTLVISGGYKKINPYSKFAFVIGESAKTEYSIVSYNPKPKYEIPGGERLPDPLPSYTNYTRKGSTPVGISGLVGCEFRVFRNFKLFTELEFLTMKYSPEKGYFDTFRLEGATYGSGVVFDYLSESMIIDIKNGQESDYVETIRNTVSINNANLNFGIVYNF